MAAGITIDDLMAAFASLAKPTDGSQGWTTAEIAAAKGWSEERVRKELRRADVAGILRRGRKQMRRIDEAATTVPCYWTETPPVAAKKSRPS